MKKLFCAVLLLSLLTAACALADGYAYNNYNYSRGVFAQYYGMGFDGYMDADGTRWEDDMTLRVISKSASVWSDPRTNSKKLGSVSFGETIQCTDTYMEKGFYPVKYKGQYGYINSAYVVRAPFQIVLMESNVPAYSAPDRASKKVGSMAKLTRYDVIGFYDDFYIVNLRNAPACAFIPTDVAHYDTGFEEEFEDAGKTSMVTTAKTPLRCGPGYNYAEVETVKSGYTFQALGRVNGWYIMKYSSKSTDGTVFVYVDPDCAAYN